ncbi:type 4a pilus biogenesis protein PilO [Oleiagrimonas sp. C23AA]|uniref:type 4a pilus biogenesis protein PilO n=1 Tax=Oleiagrimonas sp. C23AA TaxID=2719047 RepID=UPI0014235C5B|nr:type 4a pilus biogenesis protein PilO [Oleiagrimonas sp. C23AA]NII09813.1 type 4a pilus biogenesis protein PilO [Oleiagrimonas sp. C23AA]
MSFIDDLRNLDRNNVGGWPTSVKGFFTGLLVVVIIFFGWYLYVSDQQDDLERYRRQEVQLKQEFAKKQAKAANLVALRKQLDSMQDMLRQLLRQLPSKTEMPQLLVDISQTALAAGLQVDLFQPGPEAPKEFYAEKPIQIRMAGTYHQFGTFISGVASLPRVVILTMHNVSLSPQRAAAKGADPVPGGVLVLQGTVKTYRYLDEDETAKQAAKGKSRRGRK